MDFGNQWAGAAYYGGPVYDGYGYALPPQHDPSMYAAAAAYGAYPVYGTHQQQVSWEKKRFPHVLAATNNQRERGAMSSSLSNEDILTLESLVL